MNASYHLPQIQLLIEGWTPVADPLAEGITAKLGLDLWGMAPLHVAFLSKTMAVFAAVAYTFAKNPTGLTIPGMALLWLGVALQALRQFRGAVRWVVLGAMIWILPLMRFQMFVDEALAFASFGLLLTMVRNLECRHCDWWRLGLWTTWMVAIKLNGVLAAAVFWCIFADAMLWNHRARWARQLGQFALLGMAVAVLALVIVWNPYGTSWQRFGHPLYPFMTTDQERFPVQDLTWDIRVANDDYKSLGRAGLWTYHFVSPNLITAVGKWTSGKQDFQPHSAWFSDQYVSKTVRPWLWMLFGVLLLHPKGRMWGMGGVLLTMLVSWEKIGYLRYQPWLSALGCLAVGVVGESVVARWGQKAEKVLGVMLLVLFAGSGVFWLWHHARDVAFLSTECPIRREQVRCHFWTFAREPGDGVVEADFTPRDNYLTVMENQCRLLMMEWGRAEQTRVLTIDGWKPIYGENHMKVAAQPLWMWDERQWFAPEGERDKRTVTELGAPWYNGNVWDGFPDANGAEGWIMTPWWFYYVRWGDRTEHIAEYYLEGNRAPGEGRLAWLGRRLGTVARIWGVTYPKEVGKWLVGRGAQSGG